MINVKNFHCDPSGCGLYFTVPASLNEIAHEHLQFCIDTGYEYKEAVIEVQGSTTIVHCPRCNKEAWRVTT